LGDTWFPQNFLGLHNVYIISLINAMILFWIKNVSQGYTKQNGITFTFYKMEIKLYYAALKTAKEDIPWC
jgi:hypothetical protein